MSYTVFLSSVLYFMIQILSQPFIHIIGYLIASLLFFLLLIWIFSYISAMISRRDFK